MIPAPVAVRVLIPLLAIAVLFSPPPGRAQETRKIPRIGVVGPGPGDPLADAFRQGLRDLGHVEGQNLQIEYRSGRPEKLPELIADLVRLNVDVIVASSQGAVAARQGTSVVPIVMPIITDPVRLGLVASFARPGGNATGIATQNEELPGKWMALLREALPKVTRVAMLFHPTYDGGVQRKASEAAATTLGIRLHALNVESPEDLPSAFGEIRRHRAEALIISSSPLFYTARGRIVEFAATTQLPTIYHQSEFVVASGGLMSYAADFRDLFRRAAGYVDKILKGARPGDLPVERPTRFELVINLKAAKALGLTIPAPLLLRADRVIE